MPNDDRNTGPPEPPIVATIVPPSAAQPSPSGFVVTRPMVYFIGIPVAAIVFIVLAVNRPASTQPTDPNRSAPTPLNSVVTLKKDGLGFMHYEDLETALKYHQSGDHKLEDDFILLGISAGKITEFDRGEEVIVVGGGFMKGKRVRRRGDPREFWVASDLL